jgi:hypothetical protein
MECAGFTKEFLIGKLPFLEYDIKVFLNVTGTGKASVPDFEPSQFGKMMIAHGLG